MVEFYKGIQQKQTELIEFTDFLVEYCDCDVMLEIGAYEGKSSEYWSELFEVVITVDLKDPPKNLPENVIWVKGNTHEPETLDLVKEKLTELGKRKVDFLFIDGDHSAKGVKDDYLNFESKVKKGGIIAFHDIVKSDFHAKHKCFVNEFWEEFRENNLVSEIIHEPKYWGGIGIYEKQ